MPLGERIAHMAPEGRLRLRDPFDEVVVGPGDVLPKVESGDVHAPAAFACLSNATEDAGEFVQRVPPTPRSLRPSLSAQAPPRRRRPAARAEVLSTERSVARARASG